MILLYSNITLLTHVGTDVIVEIPNFDDVDESFKRKNFLLPQNQEPEYQT